MESNTYHVSNGDGWRLSIKRIADPVHFRKSWRPLLIVPGYGMNNFIFGYHPTGQSMIEYLAAEGFEVWTVNLRTQGDSICDGGSYDYGMSEVSLIDVPCAVNYVADNTRTSREKVDLVGCSLGGAMIYAMTALTDNSRVGSIISLGAPFSWVEIHPILKFAFGSPRIASMLKLSHTRDLAKIFLPILAKIPKLLHIYIHPEIVDLSNAKTLCETVEDPVSKLNRDISEWIINKDLIINGQNVTKEFAKVDKPLFLMLANADGIVPDKTALSALDVSCSSDKSYVVAGNDEIEMAHADMYVSKYAEAMVFAPMADWLIDRNEA